ncbi:hypothetical protein ACFVH0_06295 [Streptomyces sp. NPDC127117]|uniref:hypothetical protein n=1 Tax=Streptomyces sp. NPDC127117 TaxID=3345368 RepID=UPI00363E7B0E
MAARPDDMWELVNSLHILQPPTPAVRRPPSAHAPWLRHVRTHCAGRDLRALIRYVTTLVPRLGDFPDFLTPSGTDSFDTSLDLIHATPAARLRTELAMHLRRRAPPPRARRLADGDRTARREPRSALTTYHRELLAPQLPVIGEMFHLERAQHSRDILRRAGLVTGTRRGCVVLHALPPSAAPWPAPARTPAAPGQRGRGPGMRTPAARNLIPTSAAGAPRGPPVRRASAPARGRPQP